MFACKELTTFAVNVLAIRHNKTTDLYSWYMAVSVTERNVKLIIVAQFTSTVWADTKKDPLQVSTKQKLQCVT